MSLDYPDKPTQHKAPSERRAEPVYFGVYIGGILLLSYASGLLQRWAGWNLGTAPIALIIPLSRGIAVLACRLAGVSREESHQEIIERSAGAALAPHLSEAPVFDMGRAKRPRARIDRDSFSGYCSGSAWTRVAWKDVGSYVVTTRRDVFGNPSYCHIRLEGHQKFHTIFQAQLIQADAPQVLAAIRFYLRGEEGQEAALQVLGGS